MANLSRECIRVSSCSCEGRQCIRRSDRVDMLVFNQDGILLKTEEMGLGFMENCIVPKTWAEQLLDIDGVRREVPRVSGQDL